ncbi:MAG: hypothetical protein ACK56I_02580, partial [bacterium]
VGVAPEQREGLVEKLLVLVAVEQAGAQRGVEVGTRLQARHLQRLQRELHPVAAHRQPGMAQHAREVHDVFGQAVRARAGQGGPARGAAPGAEAGARAQVQGRQARPARGPGARRRAGG